MRYCPQCHELIRASAIVSAFNDPDTWQFWGTPGQRWIVCQADSYVHFRVALGRKQQHRLAIIHGHAGDWMATERAAAEKNAHLLGTSRNQLDMPNHDYYAKSDDWLGD